MGEKKELWKAIDILLNFNGKFAPGYLYKPEVVQKKYGAVVLCHGNYGEGKDIDLILEIAKGLANSGYVVLTFDNLLYNKGWRPNNNVPVQPEEVDFRWAAYAAVSYLCELDYVDKNDITIIGHSLGATISLAVGALDERISRVVCISPTRVSRFIFDAEKSESFWKSNIQERLDVKMDVNTMRIIRSVLLEESNIPFLKNLKPVLFMYGRGERYFGYDKWIENLANNIGQNAELSFIPKARHYFGTKPDPEDRAITEQLIATLEHWMNAKK